jgi:hypothetical protein
LEFVKSKFNLRIRNNSVRNEHGMKLVSVLKSSLLIMHRKIFAVCSQIHTKHTNTLYGQNGELLNVKLVVGKLTPGL